MSRILTDSEQARLEKKCIVVPTGIEVEDQQKHTETALSKKMIKGRNMFIYLSIIIYSIYTVSVLRITQWLFPHPHV